jgi:uncharacterized integral membrane protein
MQTIKLIVLGLLAVILIIIGGANMAPVDLFLVPSALTAERFSVKGVPLAVVILAATLLGIIVGHVLELIRGRKHRVLAEMKRRELDDLREEVTQLRAQLRDQGDDLPRIAAL